MKTFETISKFDSTEYSLAAGENGQVTIYQKNAIELTTKYVGMWLIINKELFYISGATPNNDSIDLIIQEPIFAFSRQVEYDGSTSYGDLIKNILDDNFGINCSDSEYKLSYLTVSNTDSTPCKIETDDYGFVIPYEVFDDALYEGVDISFNFTNTELLVSISTVNYETGIVVFNDGSTTLESESYDANYIAKVTVIHDLPTPEPEPESDPALEEDPDPGQIFEVIDYYLSTDGHISTTPPVNRAKGIWKYYNASQDENPLSVAIGAFSHNNDNHKIEFRSLTRFALYQPIKMRLRQEIFTTIITARILSSGDNRYYYKCGNLATTLTDKIDSSEDENAKEIKHIKNKIARISGVNTTGSGIVIQDDEPTGNELVWIDTDDDGSVHQVLELSDFDSANGHCKMPDGTLIQWGSIIIEQGSTVQYVGQTYQMPVSLSLPIPFVDTNYRVFGSSKFASGGAIAIGHDVSQSTESSAYLRAWDYTSRTLSSSAILKIWWIAIGRWR